MSGADSKDFFTDLQNSIRDNPVPATLVGLGVLWMFAGGHRISTAAALLGSGVGTAASGVGTGAHRAAEAVTGAVSSLGGQVGSTLRDGAEAVLSSAGSAASRTYEASQSTAASAGPALGKGADAARHYAGAVQGNLAETFARQPLLLGALGLAVGAGMATAFSATRIEKDLMGSTAGDLAAKAKTFASDVGSEISAAAERGLAAAKEEAGRQGLTTEGLRDVKTSIGETVQAVAQAAKASGNTSGGSAG